jgi:zinc protease
MLTPATRLFGGAFSSLARRAFSLVLAAGLLGAAGDAGAVTPVQRVTSPGGLEAWLMESHEVKLIRMKFSFEGGTLAELEGKAGAAYLAAYLFNEGAGDMDAAELTRRRQRIGVQYYGQADYARVTVTFATPSKHRTEGFELLGLALRSPRFDEEPIARAKSEAEAALTQELKNPSAIAVNALTRQIYGSLRYASPINGTLESLPGITRADIEDFRRRTFAGSNLKIAVAGDITPEELGPLLDKLFAALPERAEILPQPALPEQAPMARLHSMELAQTIVVFGNLAPRLTWRQKLAADIANYILSASYTSRLFMEVREKRGLVYTISTNRMDLDDHSLFLGSFGAGPENAGPALEVKREVLSRFLAEGPTEAEVRAAKDAFTGGYLLSLDTSDSLASTLLGMQRLGLPTTYLDDFAGIIDSISREEVLEAARLVIRPDIMTTVAVGKPDAGFRLEPASAKAE